MKAKLWLHHNWHRSKRLLGDVVECSVRATKRAAVTSKRDYPGITLFEVTSVEFVLSFEYSRSGLVSSLRRAAYGGKARVFTLELVQAGHRTLERFTCFVEDARVSRDAWTLKLQVQSGTAQRWKRKLKKRRAVPRRKLKKAA